MASQTSRSASGAQGPGGPHGNAPEEREGGPAISPLEILQFVVGSARRNRPLCVAVGLCVAILGFVVAMAVPSQYEVSAKIHLLQSASQLTNSLATGRTSDPFLVLKGVEEAVLNRSNLASIAREAKLEGSWKKSRTWPLQLKDSIMTGLFGPMKPEDMERALIEQLERSLAVTVSETSSISFWVQWRDAKGAFDIASLAMRNYLDSRSSDEVDAIKRAITVLEEQLKQTEAPLAEAIAEVQRVVAKAEAERVKDGSGTATPTPSAEPSRSASPSTASSKAPLAAAGDAVLTRARLDQAHARLQEVRRTEREIVEPWQRYNASLRNQLTEMRATFGPEHPAVRAQEAKISAATEEPPELRSLRAEEAELLATIAEAEGGEAPDKGTSRSARSSRRSSATTSALASIRSLTERQPDSPEVVTARMRLDSAIAKQEDLAERLDAARVDLATARASAKYLVVQEPELPRKPTKPKRFLLYLGALIAGLLFGTLAGAVRELLTGQILEPWQIRMMGVDVLSEVDVDDLVRRP